ncbi:DUF2975 domain-containing protein [Parabacteroides sp. AM08-6]|uniref:DUF2975 domain-containing protein n=1 Tax=Parabacteroides sp. AM08-6 TaxID=2292053 RepID=UPI000EFEAC32|nr:DUF2975 domain-containing protein [Parabacteroides sp. AM08-6]RHJ78686.1 DUF2975 domain-containing protein [Parabacteroides sp. AM08-6]
MKRQLNLICILIFLCLGLSLIPHALMVCNGFIEGFKYGMEQAEDARKSGMTSFDAPSPVELSLWPKSLAVSPDKVFNLKTNEWVPAQHLKSLLWVRPEHTFFPTAVNGLFSLLGLIAILYAIVQFYKLINAINHEIIFEWVNVRKLTRIGIALLLSFLLMQTFWLLNYLLVRETVELEGYTVSFWMDFKAIELVLGLIALLVGRIFAMGITLREEQELTI